jgi:hypothetical protein
MCGIQCTGVPTTAGTGCSKCDFSVIFDGLNYIYDGRMTESAGTRFDKIALFLEVQKVICSFVSCALLISASTCRASYNMDGLTLVDQSEFLTPFDEKVSMLPDAVLYMPTQCRVNSSRCSLHVAFHGCRHSM